MRMMVDNSLRTKWPLRGSQSRFGAPEAVLRAKRARGAVLRLQRQDGEMDCALGIRRDDRTRQTEGGNIRRGISETRRQPGAAVIEVEGRSLSVEGASSE